MQRGRILIAVSLELPCKYLSIFFRFHVLCSDFPSRNFANGSNSDPDFSRIFVGLFRFLVFSVPILSFVTVNGSNSDCNFSRTSIGRSRNIREIYSVFIFFPLFLRSD